MLTLKSVSFVVPIILIGLAAVPSVKADPLFFSNVVALQNGGATRVDLFSNPGITLLGPQISFLVDITGTLPPGGTDTLSITYNQAGSPPITLMFSIPAFGTIQPPFTQLFTIDTPVVNFQDIGATITVDILGSSPDFIIPSGSNVGQRVDSFTYSFRVSQPVPEPATVALLACGLVALSKKIRNKKLNSNDRSLE